MIIEKRDPILLPKSKKNDAEIGGMKEAHQLDGIALAKFLRWFDAEAPKGKLTEIGIVEALEHFRREEPSCVDASFDTISGSGPNGAIVHYRVDESSNRTLKPGELMLLDSGAQYLSGTTDITRTMFTGKATAEQKDRFTRVLKGMIALSMAALPARHLGRAARRAGPPVPLAGRRHLQPRHRPRRRRLPRRARRPGRLLDRATPRRSSRA